MLLSTRLSDCEYNLKTISTIILNYSKSFWTRKMFTKLPKIVNAALERFMAFLCTFTIFLTPLSKAQKEMGIVHVFCSHFRTKGPMERDNSRNIFLWKMCFRYLARGNLRYKDAKFLKLFKDFKRKMKKNIKNLS